MRSALVAGLVLLLADAVPLRAAPGDPIGVEFQVNTYTTGPQFRPVVRPIAGGGFVVVWQSNDGDGTDTQGSIQGQRAIASSSAAGWWTSG